MNWHDYFTYDADTGNLIWKRRDLRSFANERMGKVWNTRFAGKVAGGKHNGGYYHVAVSGFKTLVHRVIWEMFYGSLMDGEQVDHIDMDRTNCRIENLRKCSNAQNTRNSRKRSNNTSGYKGVTGCGNRWKAQIGANYHNTHLGVFRTPEEAHEAYCLAAAELHGEFSRTA